MDRLKELAEVKGELGNVTNALKESIASIKSSIPLANNEYVRTGYEISLVIIKEALERNGVSTENLDLEDID